MAKKNLFFCFKTTWNITILIGLFLAQGNGIFSFEVFFGICELFKRIFGIDTYIISENFSLISKSAQIPKFFVE